MYFFSLESSLLFLFSFFFFSLFFVVVVGFEYIINKYLLLTKVGSSYIFVICYSF